MITHKHHIIPRHAGGGDAPTNIVVLTIPEHAEAHKKLYEEHGRWQDEVAWLSLSGQISGAEAIKEAQIKGNLGSKRRVGYVMPEETKRKISKSNTGKKATEEHRINNSDAHKGYKQSASHNKNRSEACKKTYKITFPGGRVEVIKGMRDFAKKNGLTACYLYALATGRRKHYRHYKVERLWQPN